MSQAPLRVLFASGRIASNTLRYRVRMAEELLRSRGIATQAVHSDDPLLSAWVEAADILVVYRAPASRRLIAAIERARERGIPVTFDVDDLVFVPSRLATVPFLDDLPDEQVKEMEEEARLQEQVVGLVDQCSAATEPLVAALRTLTDVPARVLPNGLSPQGARIAAATHRRPADDLVRLGYFPGSATHNEDWQLIERAVIDVMVAHPEVQLMIIGPLDTGDALEPVMDQVRRPRPVPWQVLPQRIAHVDVNLAPLAVTPFTEAKSAIKWLEAAVVGTPTIASATQPFVDAVDDGTTGILVAPDADWHAAIELLVSDAAERQRMGEAARSSALERFGPVPQAALYEQFVRDAIDGSRRQVSAVALTDLAQSLPPSRGLGIGLEPYPVDDDVAHLDLVAPRGAAALERLRRGVRRGRASARRGRASALRARTRARRLAARVRARV